MRRLHLGPLAAVVLFAVVLGCFVASFAVRPSAGPVVLSGEKGPIAAAPGHEAHMALPGWLGGAPSSGSMTLRFSFADAHPRAGQVVVRGGSAASGVEARLERLLGSAPALVLRLSPWPGGPLRAVLVPHVLPGRRYELRVVLAGMQTVTAWSNGVEVVSFRAPQPTIGTLFRPLVAGSAPVGPRTGPAAGPSVEGVVLAYRVLAATGSATAATALLTAAGIAAMALVCLLVVGLVSRSGGRLLAGVARRAGATVAWCRRHLGLTGAVALVLGGVLLQVVTPPADAVGPRVGYERLAAASVPSGHEVRELLTPQPELASGRPSADARLSLTFVAHRRERAGTVVATTWVHGTGIAVRTGRYGSLVASIRTFAEQGGTFLLERHMPIGRPVHVLVRAVRSRAVTAYVDGIQVYAYTYASPVWAPEPTGLEVGSPRSAFTVSQLRATTVLYGDPTPASSLLVVRLLQALGFVVVAAGAVALASRFLRRLFPAATPPRPLVRAVFGVAAAGIAVNLLVDALHLQRPPALYTPRNTWLFASDARFSDFLQTFDLLRGLHPYGAQAGSYPPIGYFLVGPFEAMSEFAALLAFLALFAGVFGWWCWRAFGGGRRLEALGVLVVAFASYPVSFAVDRANVGLIVALLLVFAVAELERRREWLSAGLIGLAAAAKVFPALYVLLFVRPSRRWRYALGAVLTAAVATLAAFLALPGPLAATVGGLRQGIGIVEIVYRNGVQSTLTSTTLSSWLQAIGYAVGGAPAAQAIERVVSHLITPEEVLGALLLGWYLWRRERSTWRAVTLVTVAVLLLPQVAYAYDLVYLFVPLALFVRDAPVGPSSLRVAALFGLLLAPKSYLYFSTSFIDTSTLFNAPLLLALAVVVVLDGRAEARAAEAPPSEEIARGLPILGNAAWSPAARLGRRARPAVRRSP